MNNKNTEQNPKDSMFNPLSPTNEPMVMESLCINCEKNGKTTILLTQIPFFKEIIIVSFCCEECGYKNNEVQSGGKLNDLGSKISLTLTKLEDLSRDVIKSEFASIRIPELDFEIPVSKKGSLNTIEGFLTNFYDELNMHQEQRKVQHPETATKLEFFLNKLEQYSLGKTFPFTFTIDDPSGNSHIKNPHAPQKDPMLKIETYERTHQQLQEMGFEVENSIIDQATIPEKNLQENVVLEEKKTNEIQQNKENAMQVGAHRLDFTKPYNDNLDLKSESFGFTTECHVCRAVAETKMCVIAIPYFKELIIMSTVCTKCGARSADTKTGGEMSKLGKIITLHVDCEDDLKRDCFKSETCHVEIPEVDLELANGTLGGRYTTIEGLIEEVEKSLKNNNPFFGDSADSLFKKRMHEFFEKLKALRKMKMTFTVILKDPMSNSFIQNPYYPEKDPRCEAVEYERSYEENEFLGLNDMKTENYT